MTMMKMVMITMMTMMICRPNLVILLVRGWEDRGWENHRFRAGSVVIQDEVEEDERGMDYDDDDDD